VLKFLLPFIIFLSLLSSCAGPTKPQVKQPVNEPRITEEDINENRKIGPEQPQMQQPQTNTPQDLGMPGMPPSSGPATVEQGTRQPRRFIWRDKKSGSNKNWEPDSSSEREQ
jgi:hypothetical protein